MPNATASRGRTLAEVLVAMAIGGVLLALLTAALIGNQRLITGVTAIAESRAHVRQALQIVPVVLRGSFANVGGLAAVHDTLVETSYAIGSGVVCQPSPPNRIILAPDTVANGQRYGGWLHSMRPGDEAHVFDPGTLPGPSDDKWWTAQVSAIVSLPNGCTGSPFLDPLLDATHRGRAVTLTAAVPLPLPASVPPGALVHFTRRTRLFLYSTSGGYHLGASDLDPIGSGWSIVQPVSGPYSSARAAPAGVQFSLSDSLGAQLPLGGPAAAGSALLSLRLRSPTASPVRVPGLSRGLRTESLSVHIALRNR